VNFSISEILVVLLIALLVIKPEQLPDVARTLGKFAKSIRGIYQKIKSEMDSIVDNKQP
jgi:Sec-independent protein translocase protein TatA